MVFKIIFPPQIHELNQYTITLGDNNDILAELKAKMEK
ncbi:hypothetical protein FLJC2902T_31390 [Flavobacterium limnosediminis JC2902]|uniref:Uncharacterized protein n=1 Tax=Flavobacterium limnosediminis JC2902 TaxID=1341181 RepID=V6SFH4_9FLAO|nr:hypothetical protein FLJC2902T_31390 [Flavobacterium limnosediminis JC2902]